MLCPTCNGETRVVDARLKDGQFRRRRECLAGCGRFNTIEIPVDAFQHMRRATLPAATDRFRARIDRAVAILTEAEK